jgi:predicted CxxxxCH...CXXCH cytochrome family protein
MNTGTGTGSHTKHAQTYAMNCNICHNGAGEGTSEHADYNIELSFSGATAPGTTYGSSGGNVVPGTAYQTCSNSYCHSNSLGAYANPAPTWGAAGTVTCSSCHGNSPTTLTTGTHPDHLNNGATCNNCHNATAASDTTLAASFLTYHVDHYVSMELDAASGVGATYNGQSVSGTVYQKTVNTAFGACTNATCHVSAYSSAYATTPTWGNNAAPCGACHPIDANGAPATGSHDDHLTNGSACNNCHPSAVAGTTGGLAHLNGVIDVYVTSPGDLGYPEAVAKHASGSGYSTCTNASCHTSGVGIWTGTTSLVTTPTWGSASSTACSACHGNTTYTDYRQAAPLYTSPTPKPNAHSPHTTVAAINTGETQCLDCHNATISSTANNAVNGANHINGNYNVTGGTAAYASGENVSTSVTVSLTMSTFAANTVSTCANVSCHPNGVGGTKPAIAWNDTSASYDCTNCHNINLTLATSYHHSMNTTTYTPNTAVTTDYPTTVPQGDWSTGTNPTSRKCLMCHVKHNVFSDRMNASNSTGGRAMNLRAAIGTTPNPADTTTYSNSDYSGTGSNGICISCHTNELVKDQTRQKAEANGTHAVAVPNSGYSGAAHQYNVALTTKTGATTFNGNCSKCHNAENGETAQFYSTNNFGTHDSTEIGTTYVRRLLSALGITTAPPTDSLDAKFCFRCHSKTTDTTPGGGPAKGTAGRDYYGAAGAAMTSADEDTFTTYQEAYSHPVSTYNGLHKTSPTDETRAYIAANVHVECADCHDPHNATKGDHIELAGTATSGSTTTLVDTTKTWTANQWNGYELRIVSGTGTQQFATVTGTTAPSTLTFAAITTAPASGSGYQLVPALAKVLTGASSVGVANWQADSGTATAATTTSLTCSSKTWTASAWVGANLQVGVSGSSGTTGLWQSSTITANTSSVLTVSPAFTTAPSATTLFRIVTFNPSSTTAALGTAPTAEYQVCFKCHSGANANVATWAGGTTSLAWTDLALDFNPNNASRHPVASALATASQLTTAKLTGGWKPGDVMTCSDCHATDSAVSKGPHGSAVRWMLAGTNKAWPFTAASSNGATTGTYVTFGGRTTGSGTVNGLFCLNCHTLSSTNVMHTAINTWSSSHQSFNVVCVNCHIRVPHGGKIGRLLATANVPGRLKASGNNSWDGSYNINSFMATGAAIGFNCSNGSHSGGTQAW